MIGDEMGRQLHDKASLGKQLTASEQAQLMAWYAAHDTAEAAQLTQPAIVIELEALQRQIDVASTQLIEATTRIQQTAAENDKLRLEIAHLRQRLASQRHPA